ncbi:hypothetical protein ACP70R_040596 [Stipagrostis hirtigluma subsp. patula]
MDPPAISKLRKRLASIDTSREPAPRPERASKAPAGEQSSEPEAGGEPMSPVGRLFREARFNCYIVAVIGLGAAVDMAAMRAGLEATLVRHPRFCSVQKE